MIDRRPGGRRVVLLVVALLVLLGLAGQGVSAWREQAAFGDRVARGACFELTDAHGRPREGPWFEGELPLGVGDRLWLRPTLGRAAATLLLAHGVRELDLCLGADAMVRVVPGPRCALLLEAGGGGAADPVRVPLRQALPERTAFELAVHSEPFELWLDGELAFRAPPAAGLPALPERGWWLQVVGGPARVLAVGSGEAHDPLDRLPAAAWVPAVIARLGLSVLLAAAWLSLVWIVLPARLAEAGVVLACAAAPSVCALRWDVPFLPIVMAICGLFGALGMLRHHAAPAGRAAGLLQRGLALLFAAIAWWPAGAPAPVLARAADERGAGDERSQPYAIDRAVTCDPGNALTVPGRFGDFDLHALLQPLPDSVIELRLRAPDRDRAEGVALFCGNDPRVRTGFVLQRQEGFEPSGSWTLPQAEVGARPRRIDLRLSARGGALAAHIDGVRVAATRDPAPSAGWLTLLVPRGEVVVEQLTVEPLAAADDAGASPARAAWSVALFGLLILSAARWLDLGLWCALWWSAVMAVPLRIAALMTPPASVEVATTQALLAALALLFAILTLCWRRRLVTASGWIVLPLVLLAAVHSSVEQWQRAVVAVVPPSILDWSGPRLEQDTVWLTHSGLRRGNAWLAQHRFNGRSVAQTRAAGLRVLVLGADESADLDERNGFVHGYPAQLEPLLTARLQAPVEVLDAAFHRACGSALFRMLRDVLLASADGKGFAPDAVVLMLHPARLTSLPGWNDEAYLERICEGHHHHTLLQRLVDHRARRRADFLPTDTAAYGEQVRRFAELLRAHAVPLVVVIPPWSRDRPAPPPYYRALGAALRSLPGVTSLDATELLANVPGQPTLMIDDLVYSRAGHARLAAALATLLVALLEEPR